MGRKNKKNKLYLIQVYGDMDRSGEPAWLYPWDEQTMSVMGENYYHAYGTRASGIRAAKEFARLNGYKKYRVEEYSA